MTVENVLKTMEEINQRPVNIAKTVYENVYNRRHEWYKNEQKHLFYSPINEIIYQKASGQQSNNGKPVLNNCIPLKDGALDPTKQGFPTDLSQNMMNKLDIDRSYSYKHYDNQKSNMMQVDMAKTPLEDSKNPEIMYSPEQKLFIGSLEKIGVKVSDIK